MTATRQPRIWAVHGSRRGDNNQILGLAEELGWPFETRTLCYNLWRLVGGRVIGSSLLSLKRKQRQYIAPPWPDIVVATGRNSVPAARYIRRMSGNRTKLVLIGHPRVDATDFDLLITSPSYPTPKHRNVLVSALVFSRIKPAMSANDEEQAWLERLPRPHLLMAIGGSTWHYRLLPDRMAEIAGKLADRADTHGGTLIVSGSPRTDAKVLPAIAARLAGTHHVIAPTVAFPRFPILINDADEIFPTADSLSMMSEAVLTGKPSGIVPVTIKATGRDSIANAVNPKRKHRLRDLSRVWRALTDAGLIGTVEQPCAGIAEDPLIPAAAAVRKLLDDRAD